MFEKYFVLFYKETCELLETVQMFCTTYKSTCVEMYFYMLM